MSILDTAIALASRAHAGQTDKAGHPYILHPLRLMLRFDDLDAQVVAVLHDVIEDSEHALEDLQALGFGPQVISAIDCLTKRPREDYQTFIARVAGHPLATRVKIEDIRDNLDVSRLQTLTDNDLERVRKYHQALAYLTGLPRM
ncbi:GTP pyrophosphokinase [Pseudomonas putida]